ncbi:MAG: ribonuclease P protein component [Thermodesulfobacteria bacterium]|nr:ribonuclease P protein component [Thermodesulfobacteriota bacterium]
MAAHGLKREGFSKAERLRRRKEFERVYQQGRRLRLPYLKLVLAPNELGLRRIGLSVSRRFGKAVRRNRAKRILREIFRRHKDIFPAAHDVIFIPRPDLLEKRQEDIVRDLEEILENYEKDRLDPR